MKMKGQHLTRAKILKMLFTSIKLFLFVNTNVSASIYGNKS